ncbi:MAG TPA: bifunctional folylpolyglutamate synthase/dihydrofolate synthase, partial [Firmicutes bacterium]|nr:bifunctional folylpolyglutamate synthase/dihydrofolate synthase [Bacillota bacterium]
RRLRLVTGILADKAVDEILSLLIPLATAGVIITTPHNPRAADPHLVAEMAGRYAGEVPVEVVPDVDVAVRAAVAQTRPEEALCICGSLYTVSEARETLKLLFPQADKDNRGGMQ